MISLLPVRGLPLIKEGDQLAQLIVDALEAEGQRLELDDVLVVAQKIISKAEGRVVQLEGVVPSERAIELGSRSDKDPRLVELVLRESKDVLRVRPGLLVVEDRRGLICANAGIDRSNVEQRGLSEDVVLLPEDPDRSALELRGRLETLTGKKIGVVINDSHGRPFREGTIGVAIGVSGMTALSDRRGDIDLTGYALQHTVIGTADEIASAASMVMGPAAEAVPAVVVRGLRLPPGEGKARDLQRPAERDTFR